MQFLHDQPPTTELTYNDVFLVPRKTTISSRQDVSLTTPDPLALPLPIMVSNMTAVAGKRMAEVTARRGAVTVLPQDTPPDMLASMISYVKSCHPVFDTPITLTRTQTVNDALSLIPKRSHGHAIIVENGKPVGVVSERMLGSLDRFTRLGDIMQTHLITVRDTAKPDTIYTTLDTHRLTFVPVVNRSGKLVGCATKKSALRSTLYKPALDAKGRLLVAAAVGINGDVVAKAKFLVEHGADIIVIDTAHGHQQKMIDAIGAVRAALPSVPIVAGNVATAEATTELLNAGADIVKVGIGPGAMCTTRMMTGVGRPQFSAVYECAQAARSLGKHVVADGGIRHPRDVALALAAGASSVMFASWLTGTHESAADMIRDNEGRLYKVNYGMASHRAVKNRNARETPFDQARKELFQEGISESRIYLDPSAPGVEDILDKIASGLRSAMTYSDAATIDEFSANAIIGIQSTAGYDEGRPLHTSWM